MRLENVTGTFNLQNIIESNYLISNTDGLFNVRINAPADSGHRDDMPAFPERFVIFVRTWNKTGYRYRHSFPPRQARIELEIWL